MMHTILWPALCLAPCLLFSQTVDSAAFLQVDSLIRVSRTLTGKREFDKAFEVNAAAEKLALEKFGRESAKYGNCCFNRGKINYINRNYPEAQKWFLEVKAIREKTLGKEHLDYAKSLMILGVLFQNMDAYEQAELFMLNAIAIYEKILGKEHADYASSLNSLASLYKDMDNYEKAELCLLNAIDIYEKILGQKNPDYASSLNSLASLYKDMGNYEKAESLYLATIDIWEKELGKDHPYYATDLNNLAILYTEIGLVEKAEPLYIEISQLEQDELRKAIFLSEQELRYYVGLFYSSQDEALSFVQQSANKKITEVCFDNSLFYKGFVLQAIGQIKRLSLSNPLIAENLNLLKTYASNLAYQYDLPIADFDSTAVAALKDQVEELEKELAQTCGQAFQQVKWQQVQAALRPNEAAVEFVNYFFDPKEQTDSMMYAALVLLSGAASPIFIPLFEEEQLATLLKTEGKQQPAFYNNLYAAGKTGDQLYNLIWKPIAAALPKGTMVYCSPSGLLHRINLGAIPTPDGKTLTEKHHLNTLGSTRQLVVPQVFASTQNATAQLYGGIQYDATPLVTANSDKKSDDIAAQRGPNWGGENDSTLRGDIWNYLRWTEVEISTAAEIMKGKGIALTVKKGAEATEESFKSIGVNGPSPGILHIATHGFFFPDPKDEQMSGEKVFKVSENPMIRSGLVLAGGNHAWKTGKSLRPDLEDGILTAYEISQMNLSNTELVVLSACETGLGDLVGNEGVYGLQRAFKIAGARYLIMSLWQVPDFQTQVFMSAFYKHWLEGKMAIPEAFRTTQSELKAKYGDAFKWAGFVLVE
jgi:CHAT domain-containing protein